MKKTKTIAVFILILCLVLLPVAADARGGGGRFLFGFGAGLLTGYLFVPRPVYVPPPVYAAPPSVSSPEYYPAPVPPPAAYEYSTDARAAGPPPSSEAKCREWRMLDRRLEDRWDSYYGRWRQVPVEKWGWIDVPCNR
jgi:hypothetical protein